MSPATDSAGQPFEGRSFEPNAHAGDDGSADPALQGALDGFFHLTHGGSKTPETPAVADAWGAVIGALRGARVLTPLMAEAGELGLTPEGRVGEKSQELSVIHLEGPDGRSVAPVFSDVGSMASWNPEARPIPVPAPHAALAAASDALALMVINPGSPGAVTLRRGALKALASGGDYQPPYVDPAVAGAIAEGLQTLKEWAVSHTIRSGDTTHSLSGPEVVVLLRVAAGLSREELHQHLAAVSIAWSESPVLAALVDGLGIKVVSV